VSFNVADFTITSVSPTSQIQAPGSKAMYIVTIGSTDPLNAFAGPITLDVSGLPPGAIYSFDPKVVYANNATQNSSTLTVTLPNHTASASSARDFGSKAPLALAVLLLPLAAWRKGRKQIKLLLFLVVALAGLGAMTGCGSNGYVSQPEQTYHLIITGSYTGNTGTTITRTITTVTLTVE